MGCAQNDPQETWRGSFLTFPQRDLPPALQGKFALGEHLTRVGGTGAPLSTNLMKFQSQVSPLHHPQEVAEAIGSSLACLVLN